MPYDLKAIQKPLAGKPVWVWGLVGGVVVLGYYYWNSSHKAAQAAAATATTQGGAPANQTVDSYPTTSNGAFTYGSPTDYSGSNVVADAGNSLGNTTLETNISWITRGVTITNGGDSARIALTNFLAGKPLTPTQAAYVREVKTVLGNPPETPNLAISVISNAVPVSKSTNSIAKVNQAAKAPIVKVAAPKMVKTVIPRDTANKAAATQTKAVAGDQNPITKTAAGAAVNVTNFGNEVVSGTLVSNWLRKTFG